MRGPWLTGAVQDRADGRVLDVRSAISVMVLLVAVVALWSPSRGDAAPSAARWPVGVTRAPDPPLARPAHAAMVALDHAVLLVGGGDSGEGVGRRDNHRDGAILDLRSGRWRRIADAPFGMVSGSGISTGDVVLLFGLEIGCSTHEGERSCRGGRVRAARYDLGADQWKELRIPEAARLNAVATPQAVLWNGDDAVFYAGGETGYLEVTERGVVRVLDAPKDEGAFGPPRPIGTSGSADGIEYGPCGSGTTMVVPEGNLVRGPQLGQPPSQLWLYDSVRRVWSRAPAEPSGAGGVPLCTRGGVLLVSSDLVTRSTVANRYDLATGTWSSVDAPLVPQGVRPCTSQGFPCDVAIWSSHGAVVDVWYPARTPGARLARAWTDIAPGPDVVPLVWVGDLGITFGAEDGHGTGRGHDLFVYRPR